MATSSKKKVMVQPINAIFRMLQSHQHVQVWLYEQPHSSIIGIIIGFDEFMNLVLDDASEVKTARSGEPITNTKMKTTSSNDTTAAMENENSTAEKKSPQEKKLGRILLKGDNITLIQTIGT